MADGYKKHYHLKILPSMIMLALLIGLCIATIVIVFGQKNTISVIESKSNDISSDVILDKEQVKTYSSARIIGVGDNLIHTVIYSEAKKRAGGIGYDFDYAYANVKDLINSADILSINQETVMAKEYKLSSYPLFNSPTELGTYLVSAGFNVINLANNHCLDKWEEGLLSNIDFWKTKQDVVTTGVYKNEEDANNIRILEKNNIKFAFLGMTEFTNGLSLPKGSDVVIIKTQDEKRIQERIKKAKSLADVVVVNVHWGTEYSFEISDSQKQLARKMINWGADLILGHHPHVIQSVEYIDREDGTRGIAAYSLGNFISAQDKGYCMIGGALDVNITKNEKNGEMSFKDVRFIPLITQFEKNYSNVRIYPLDKYSQKLAESHGVRVGKTPEFSLSYINNIVTDTIPEEFLTSYSDMISED